jgi:hypothetical protein
MNLIEELEDRLFSSGEFRKYFKDEEWSKELIKPNLVVIIPYDPDICVIFDGKCNPRLFPRSTAIGELVLKGIMDGVSYSVYTSDKVNRKWLKNQITVCKLKSLI